MDTTLVTVIFGAVASLGVAVAGAYGIRARQRNSARPPPMPGSRDMEGTARFRLNDPVQREILDSLNHISMVLAEHSAERARNSAQRNQAARTAETVEFIAARAEVERADTRRMLKQLGQRFEQLVETGKVERRELLEMIRRHEEQHRRQGDSLRELRSLLEQHLGG